MRGSALSLATFMAPYEPSFATVMSWDHLVASNGTTRRVVPGCPRRSGSSTRVGADRRAAGRLCYLPTFLCLGIVPVVAGLAGDVLAPGRM